MISHRRVYLPVERHRAIVHGVGGLEDTIQNFDGATGAGNGFKFYDYHSAGLLEKINEALALYGETGLWRALMLNGMRAD